MKQAAFQLGLWTISFCSAWSLVQKLPLDRDWTKWTECLRRLVRYYRNATALLCTAVVQCAVQQFTKSRRGLGMQKCDNGQGKPFPIPRL